MTKNNIWSFSILGLLFILLFTPLYVAESLYFPFVTGKLFAFRAITALMLCAYAALVIYRPEFLPRKSSVLLASGAFVTWLAVANTFGVDSYSSFFSNFERMEGWFTHLFLFVYLVVISSVVRQERVWNWVLGTSVAVANYLSIRAAFDTEARTGVFLGNSTYVAIYVLFNLYFALFLAFRFYKKRKTLGSVAYAALAYFALSIGLFTYIIFKTQTRGTVLALVISMAGFTVLSAISLWKNKRVRIGALALLAIAALGCSLFWVNRNSAFVQQNPLLVRIATISATEGTGRARIMNWQMALNAIKENPAMGWGQENYTYVFPRFYNPQMYGQEPWFDRTHNAFLDWTVQGGIPALILYVSLFMLAAVTVFRSQTLARTEKNLLISLLGAYAIHNLFVFDNYSSYLMFFTTLAFIVHHSTAANLDWNVSRASKQVTAAIVIVIAACTTYVVVIKPYGVAKDMIRLMAVRSATELLDGYRGLFEKETFGSQEALTRYFLIASDVMRVGNAGFTKAYTDIAVAEAEKQLARTPENPRLLEFYGTFLLQIGDTKKGIEILERDRLVAPNRQNNLYMLGFGYLNDNQLAKSAETFKHAYEVAPENQKARNYYGALLLANGDSAGKALVEGYPYQDSFYLTVFNKVGMFKESIKILERLRAENPDNPEYQFNLGLAYAEDGQKAKAISLLQNVVKTAPEFATSARQLIGRIQAGR